MKSKKQAPPVDPIEYHLGIFRVQKEQKGGEALRVILQTAKQFRSFRYDLVVRESFSGSTLKLDVEGLRAPQPALPAEGPARFIKEYVVFPETMTLIVTKLDGTENVFELRVQNNGAVVVSAPQRRFVDVISDRELFD